MANSSVNVSLTELPQFRRLVSLLAEVSVHADAMGDSELREIVDACRSDLLQEADGG